ncbi:hypothetical protein EHZ25_23180 [Paraburkholderia tropica]|nr:hypothetical protein EHZ25_23180 [Paraburkholderia tropica]
MQHRRKNQPEPAATDEAIKAVDERCARNQARRDGSDRGKKKTFEGVPAHWTSAGDESNHRRVAAAVANGSTKQEQHTRWRRSRM